METLRKQISRAQWRLVLQQFAGALVWCLFFAFLVATVAIGVSKLVAVPVEPATWASAWMGGAAGLALIVAGVWTLWRRRSRLDAALEIDHRFGLKERVSSTLAMAPAELETPAGQALVGDTLARVESLNVAERFTFKPDRRMLLPLVPAVAAFALAMFVDSKGLDNPAAATSQTAVAMQVKQSSQALQKKLAERTEEAKEKGLTDAENLFKKLEAGTKDLAQKKETDRKQALIELSDLADQLKQRREKIGGDEKFKQHLNQLKDMEHGPADDMAKAMKDGDLTKATKELEKLKAKLENEALDEKERAQLAKQMEQMQQKMQKVAQAHQEAKDNLQQKLNEERKAGNTTAADKIQQQLDKLAQQDKKMGQLRKMAEKLGEASQCMKQGQCKNAGDQLGQMAAELKEMAQDSEELAMLDEALDQIADAKDAMGCKECNGEGCKACQGGGKSNKMGKGGDGLGAGIGGRGDRPENKNKTGFYDSQVRQNVGKGTAVVTDLVDGPSRKGEVQEEIKTQFEASRRESDDPLNSQRLPRDYREHAKKYFDALREGQK